MKIAYEIAAISRSLRRKQNDYMMPMGLKGVHGRLLLHVWENPGISQDGLSQKTGADKSSIARHMAALEEKNLIVRTPDPADRRVLCLQLTDQARILIPKLQEAMENWEKSLLQDFSHWEISQLMSLLNRIRQGIEEAD